MEKYIKPLQEYLTKNYGDSFEACLGDYYFDLVVLYKKSRKLVMVINEFEYSEDEFEVNLFEKCPYKFIEGIVCCLNDFREVEVKDE